MGWRDWLPGKWRGRQVERAVAESLINRDATAAPSACAAKLSSERPERKGHAAHLKRNGLALDEGTEETRAQEPQRTGLVPTFGEVFGMDRSAWLTGPGPAQILQHPPLLEWAGCPPRTDHPSSGGRGPSRSRHCRGAAGSPWVFRAAGPDR
ncbi:hypothetical protein ACH4U6_31315 [Streptomyces netropsis]|uniref:hypothetical protein n=1 Tax=Streptomyces netropsis TaxID=55404 RepID=UPI00378F5838